MREATWLNSADVHAMVDVVAQAAAADEAEPFPYHVVELLRELLPADRAGYFEYRAGGLAFDEAQAITVEAPRGAIESPWDDAISSLFDSWPLQDTRNKHSKRTLLFSDFVSTRARRRNPWYVDVMQPRGIEHECKLWLGGEPWAAQGFYFVRGPDWADFDDRDRAVLDVLRPHLVAIRVKWFGRRSPPMLTPRETEALRLAREGLTNKEIAQQLGITAGTVRSHFEHIFAKLEVHTRTAAIRRAFGGHGLDEEANRTGR